MSKISISLLDGSCCECDCIDLSSCSNRDIIQLMINSGYIVSEEELPVRNIQGDCILYSLINKNGTFVNPFENKSLTELGFVNGDNIRILPVTGGKYYNQMATLTVKLLTGESYDIRRIDLEHLTPGQLISDLIAKGVLNEPEDGLHYYHWAFVDKNNLKHTVNSNKTFSQLGFVDGDVFRIIGKFYSEPFKELTNITVKLISGEEFDVGIDLEHQTPKQLIDELISSGILLSELSLPSTADGSHSVYGIVDKNNVKVEPESNLTFGQLGFIGGDTVKIIILASAAYFVS